MTRIAWDTVGDRVFEVGVDRGVLYLDDQGVPWNGIISVSEAPDGGVVTPRFIDGVKYLDDPTLQSYKANLVAFTYPDEFAICDGTRQVGNGLFALNQKKQTFGLCYRTQLGNDTEGLDHAYLLHIVYNATATPTRHDYRTTGEGALSPSNFAWDISAKPPLHKGVAPTAHFVVDSRDTPSDLLYRIEDILYGSDQIEPRLPSLQELISMFQSYSASSFDAGFVGTAYYNLIDAGVIPETQDETIDGGSP